MIQLSEHLFLYKDTCHVYVVKNGTEAVLIDFGSGDVLDGLAAIGISRIAAVLMTHHHRDQGQGLARAAQAGIPIWVPHNEQELIANVDVHWQAREVYNNYNVRQDRYSLLEPVAIAGTLKDYETRRIAGIEFQVVPTPGHTIGSLSLLARVDGREAAFTGDLIYGPGKVWSLAATSWTYNGGEGLAASVLSLLDLKERGPDWLLPSHGEPMDSPAAAIDLLVERLQGFLQFRHQFIDLLDRRERPFEEITPNMLRNRTSFATYYVLRSKSGKALFFDFGYDFVTGIPSGADRAARRPWLYTLGTLQKQYGIERIDAVVPTHYHDDHVAGINLLRDHTGAEVWAADSFADVLRHPEQYDLPCLWYDPVSVDRELPPCVPVQWEEYEFTLYPLPGHTFYAVAIALEVDGKRLLITGDQYKGDEGLLENYIYPNRFRMNDYVQSAALYKSLQPDIILSGHWAPLEVGPGYFDELVKRGESVELRHRELLPLEDVDFGAEGLGVRLTPYQIEVSPGETFMLEAEVTNPLHRLSEATVRIVLPEGWKAEQESVTIQLEAGSTSRHGFRLTAIGAPERRKRVAADLTVNGRRFGQQAEALVTVRINKQ